MASDIIARGLGAKALGGGGTPVEPADVYKKAEVDAFLDLKVDKQRDVRSGTNLDTVIESGFYALRGTSDKFENYPSFKVEDRYRGTTGEVFTGYDSMICIHNSGTASCFQMMFAYTNPRYYAIRRGTLVGSESEKWGVWALFCERASSLQEATDAEIATGESKWVAITPHNLGKAMEEYGIFTKEQIQGMTETLAELSQEITKLISDTTKLRSDVDVALGAMATTWIKANDDLNEYLTPGIYRSDSMATSRTLQNCPIDYSGFRFEVKADAAGIDANGVHQILYPNRYDGDIWVRSFVNNRWSDWRRLASEADVEKAIAESDYFNVGIQISSGSNLDDYTTEGKYYAASSSAVGITNSPYTAGGYRLDVVNLTGSYKQQRLYPNARNSNVYYMRQLQTTWGAWVKYDRYFESGTAIAGGSDLDDYKEVGAYAVSATNATTITNSPYTTGGYRLDVVGLTGGIVQQRLYPNKVAADKIYMRVYVSDGWGVWHTFAADVDLDSIKADITQLRKDMDGIEADLKADTEELEADLKVALGDIATNKINTEDDLNTYITPGIWYSNTSTTTNTLKNCPITGMGFRLECIKISVGSVSDNIMQLLMTASGAYIFKREYVNGKWTVWKRLASEEDIASFALGEGINLNNGDNLNDYKDAGVYQCAGSVTNTLLNTPVGLASSVGIRLEVRVLTTSTRMQLITTNLSRLDYIYYRIYDGGSWSQWGELTPRPVISYDLMTGDDLNNLTTEGTFHSVNAAMSASLGNTPYTGGGFLLHVIRAHASFKTTSTDYKVYQVLYANTTMGRIFYRSSTSGGQTWGGWNEIPFIKPWHTFTTGEDLNDFDEEMVCFSPNTTLSSSLKNCPHSGSGFRLEVKKTIGFTSSNVMQVLYANSSNNVIWIRIRAGSGEWGNWSRLARADEVTAATSSISTLSAQVAAKPPIDSGIISEATSGTTIGYQCFAKTRIKADTTTHDAEWVFQTTGSYGSADNEDRFTGQFRVYIRRFNGNVQQASFVQWDYCNQNVTHETVQLLYKQDGDYWDVQLWCKCNFNYYQPHFHLVEGVTRTTDVPSIAAQWDMITAAVGKGTSLPTGYTVVKGVLPTDNAERCASDIFLSSVGGDLGDAGNYVIASTGMGISTQSFSKGSETQSFTYTLGKASNFLPRAAIVTPNIAPTYETAVNAITVRTAFTTQYDKLHIVVEVDFTKTSLTKVVINGLGIVLVGMKS